MAKCYKFEKVKVNRIPHVLGSATLMTLKSLIEYVSIRFKVNLKKWTPQQDEKIKQRQI